MSTQVSTQVSTRVSTQVSAQVSTQVSTQASTEASTEGSTELSTKVFTEVSTLSLECLLKCLLKCLLRCDPYPVGKWHSSESDVNSMVMSTSEQSSGKALMVDMGAFHLAEFAQTLCLPFVGSAVHGGVHVVQVVSQPLAMRMLMIPALDDTFKVCHHR